MVLQQKFDPSSSWGAALRLGLKRHKSSDIILRDFMGGGLTPKKLFLGAAVLERVLKRLGLGFAPFAGILLPNTVTLAPLMLALQELGSPPAMLNYTAGESNLIAACQAAQLQHVLTSRAFITKAKLESIIETLAQYVQIIYMEDVRKHIGIFDKITAVLSPCAFQQKPDDTAVLLFTSGSEGLPKGVALSHKNILFNCQQTLETVTFFDHDLMYCALPLFHSFGLMAGLILPLVAGFRGVLYPSPLHFKTICEDVRKTQPTIFISTNTFLRHYAMTMDEGDFSSVRYVVAGAEAVKQPVRDLWRQKTGGEIFEGYGVTECSPVLAVNTFENQKVGTVGQLFPHIEARLEPVEGLHEGGRLFVRGHNIMQGYILHGKPGAIQSPHEGWHDTGDIVTLDDAQFIAIKGRAKRFAKLGGEMVSLAAIEDMLQMAFPDVVFAAFAVPDVRKGEKIVLLAQATDQTIALSHIHQALREQGAATLMLPDHLFTVESLPLLGSGKADFMAGQKLAMQMVG